LSDKKLKLILPLAILAVGVLGAMILIKARRTAPQRPPDEYAPLVRVITAEPTTRRLRVRTQGTVKPRTESSLVAEVSGRVTEISPAFAAGGFFEEGDVLVRIDDRDYRSAVITARSQVAQAKVRAELEEAQAKVAREEWKSLGDGSESPLATRELQQQEARAALAAAQATLDQAERNLERTRIRAPFAGRVREKLVDVGRFVTPGVPLASVFAVDYAEVRLPIPDEELAFLDLPINYRGESEQQRGPKVILSANFAGGQHSWEGRIVRVEGEIDPVSRMVHVVAQVDDPYGRGANGEERMPLAVGLFVEAEILGYEVDDVVTLPRSALRDGDRVIVVDGEGRLRFRDVEVLRLGRDDVIIRSGITAGERICVSTLEAVTDGMKVRVGDTPAEESVPAATGGCP